MWTKIKALPIRVKIVALVFVALAGIGGIKENFIDGPSSSSGSQPWHSDVSAASSAGSTESGGSASSGQAVSASDAGAPRADSAGSGGSANSSQSNSTNSGKVLAELEAQHNVLQERNAQCYAQIQQTITNPAATPPCEAQMEWDIAQLAKLEAEIYRLKTGAPAQPIDFALVGSNSPSGGEAGGSDDGEKAVDRYDREGVRGESNYTDSDGTEYQLSTNHSYYFKDRVSGKIVGSDLAEPPDNQHDWEQLTYHPN